MVKYSNELGLPRVDTTAYLEGRKYSKPHETRGDKLKKTEKNFPKTFNDVTGERLPLNARGLVRVAFGRQPFDWEIVFNPTPSDRESKIILKTNKASKEMYYFEIHYYWWDGESLIHLLSNNEVLSEYYSKRAMKKLASFIGKETPTYIGCFKMKLSQVSGIRPYRVFEMGDEYVVIDFTNGNIYRLDALDEEKSPLGDVFSFAGTYYKKDSATSYVAY